MQSEEKTIKIYKDKKHKVEYPYGKDDHHKWYCYVAGPITNGLWYRVVEDQPKFVIAVLPGL